MAEPTPIDPAGANSRPEPGAPIARDQIDPELVKLGRTQTKVGVITAAGLVFLCILFLLRLGPDRRFAGSTPTPTPVGVADVVAGKVATEQLIAIDAEPLTSLALRTTTGKGSLGLRLAPVRGTGERLWLVVSGDGEDPPVMAGYVGRLRALGDLPLAPAARAFAAAHPRPLFATAAAVRAGFATGSVTTVGGEAVKLADGDAVELDRTLPDAATIAASFNDRLPDPAAWRAALAGAGVAPTTTSAPDPALGQIRFSVPLSVAEATTRLEAARLLDARIEPVTRHDRTTWGALRASPPAGLVIGGAPVPDAQIDLVGLYVLRGIPDDAYAVVTGELPDDYWYVMPITIALAVILLVFGWALIRAVRRDLVPPRAA